MGVVGGSREYDGPGLGLGPWKCPSCRAENSGPIDAGCVSCGSGSAPARHVGVSPPPVSDLHLTAPASTNLPNADYFADTLPAVAFEQWWKINEATLVRLQPKELARLAWESSAIAHTSRTMAAPPVTADVETLAPEGKARRTIVAALELFKDQVLRGAADEIASGEWCSIEEIEQLIETLKNQED